MITIERARESDLAALEVLIETTFIETWTGLVDDDHIRQHLLDGHARDVIAYFSGKDDTDIFVVHRDSELVGYAIGAKSDFVYGLEGYYHLEKLYLRSTIQGLGVGRQLWGVVVESAKASGANGICLTHYPLNKRASAFYNRLGLQKIAETVYRCGNGDYYDWVLAASWSDLDKTSEYKGMMA